MNILNRPQTTAAVLVLALTGLALPSAAAPRSNVTGPHTTTGTGGTTTTTTTTTGGTTTGTGKPSGGCGGTGGAGGSLISGTITAINTTAGTITVTSASGTASVLTLTTNTTIIGHQAISASAIAVGDTLDVTGVPLTVQVASLVDNKLPAPSSASGSSSSGATSSSTSGGTAPTPGMLCFTGVVTENDTKLVVSVAGTFSVTLTPASGVTLSEVLPLTVSSLATGEGVVARVNKSSSGTLTAVQVDVTPAS